ncbi:MAG: hypothetical protein IKQ15_04530, partial [Kiritimatiellae bacterium]|nr:hypothetical protein [Kiritimatiellia bacterium]
MTYIASLLLSTRHPPLQDGNTILHLHRVMQPAGGENPTFPLFLGMAPNSGATWKSHLSRGIVHKLQLSTNINRNQNINIRLLAGAQKWNPWASKSGKARASKSGRRADGRGMHSDRGSEAVAAEDG